MNRVVSVVVSGVAVAACLAACATHAETGPGAEGPSLPRLAAAPSPTSPPPEPLSLPEPLPPPELSAPPLDLASLAEDPGTASDSLAPAHPSCSENMVLVEGEYCTEVRQECVQWEDPPASKLARCARFAPTQCVGERVHKRFCVDRDEYTPPGESLPAGDISWTQSREICEREKKRLCMETEWELACEGEQMLPYPTGLDRDPGACNYDKPELTDPITGKLRDQREPSDKLARCVSPFGVRNMSGNMDEWVFRDRTGGEWRSALKGGWWMAARDRCRPATTAHDEHFHELQTGMRCCSDAL
jgi:formylglycine-generating enzyme